MCSLSLSLSDLVFNKRHLVAVFSNRKYEDMLGLHLSVICREVHEKL